MDALIIALQNVSAQLLPIIGAVALFFLCVFLRKLSLLVDKLIVSISNLETTIKLVDVSIEKAQVPLDTVVKLSGTVDNLHDSSVKSINKAKNFINENVSEVKKYVNQQFNKENIVKVEEDHE